MGSSNCICKEKTNKIKICAEYSIGLNDCQKEINYSLSTAKEIFVNLNGGRIFSKLDWSEAYSQMPVEEKRAELKHIEACTKSIGYNMKLREFQQLKKNNGYNVSRSGLCNSLFK